MSRELHKLVISDLSARKNGWEEKQRVFYEMRHEGLRRRNKPFPGAADLHYPLTDGMIDKLKPFYFAQIFGQELLAAFIAKDEQPPEVTAAVAGWFDYQMKERSNFFDESLALIDLMLMCGTAPVKVWWEPSRKEIQFDAIDPLFFVVPAGAANLEKCDRLTHIMQMSVGEYKRNSRYNHDADVIQRIRGKGIVENDSGGKQDEKYTREGITHGETDEQIVLWETYEREGERILVHTYAPCNPDVEIRKTFALPAVYKGMPFVDFPAEVKDKGYYASRGVVEREGPFEAYLTRVWNEKADAMAFLNRPMFTHEGPRSALGNIALIPGQILPGNVKRVEMGSVPFDFDQEMLNTRMTAEYHMAMPDFGLGQKGNLNKPKTATEVQAQTAMMTQTTDLRGWSFRRRMAILFQKAYSILRRYAKEDLGFVVNGGMQSVEAAALEREYAIQPEGTPDNWNRAARQQRAAQRLQMFANNPFVKQGELVRSVLEEDDPRLVRKIFDDPQLQAADQQEDQAMEIAILEMGFPARVKPADNDEVHLQSIDGRVEMIMALRLPITQLGMQRLTEHATQHVQKLASIDKKKAAQWQQRLQMRSQQFMAAIAGAAAPVAEDRGQRTENSDNAGMMMPEGMQL
jgi:hypothetical protein